MTADYLSSAGLSAIIEAVNEITGEHIPLLAKEGCPRHQKMVPFRKRRGRGGRSQVMFRNAF